MRITIDSNVLISALISRKGAPRALVNCWLIKRRFELVTCEEQFVEIQRVIAYPRVASRIDSREAELLLARLSGLPVLALPRPPGVSRDPHDDVILGAAIAGRASMLVTGDKRDLLHLGEVQGVRIVDVRTALSIVLPEGPDRG